MYLLERTFSAPVEILDPEHGIHKLVERARADALVAAGSEIVPTSIEQYVEITTGMAERKEIIYRSVHEYPIDGVHTYRHVVLYQDRDTYLMHNRDAIGIPDHIDESKLDMNLHGLTATVIVEQITRS